MITSGNAIYEELNDLLGNGLDSSPTAHLDPTLFHHRISCGSDTIVNIYIYIYIYTIDTVNYSYIM